MTTRRIKPGRTYPFYSIKELAEYVGLSVSGTRRMLYRLNVPCHLSGKKLIVYLSDMQTYQPELYNSILLANHLNGFVLETQDEDMRADDASPKQFE